MTQYEQGQSVIKIDSDDYKPIVNIYPFTYDGGNGKLVLRASLDADIYTLADIKRIFDGRRIQEYTVQYDTVKNESTEEYVNSNTPIFILINEYVNYSKELKCEYSATTNLWEVEVGKKLDEEILAENNAADIANAYDALISLYEDQ